MIWFQNAAGWMIHEMDAGEGCQSNANVGVCSLGGDVESNSLCEEDKS
jgi:hypothetical protein